MEGEFHKTSLADRSVQHSFRTIVGSYVLQSGLNSHKVLDQEPCSAWMNIPLELSEPEGPPKARSRFIKSWLMKDPDVANKVSER